MKILGKTDNGFILQASKGETRDLLKATGVKSPNPDTDDTIPIANYIQAEKSAKSFIESRNFERASNYLDKVEENFDKLRKVFEEEK